MVQMRCMHAIITSFQEASLAPGICIRGPCVWSFESSSQNARTFCLSLKAFWMRLFLSRQPSVFFALPLEAAPARSGSTRSVSHQRSCMLLARSPSGQRCGQCGKHAGWRKYVRYVINSRAVRGPAFALLPKFRPSLEAAAALG